MKAQQNQTNGNGDTMTKDSSSLMEATMTVSSTAFKNNAAIPQRFSCQGDNVSPTLAWSGEPKGTKSFALIVEDPDAPHGTYYHWVIYNIPAAEHGLAENIARRDPLPNGARQGINSAQQLGFMGPCPPAGNAHRYYFKLYALDAQINIPGEGTHDKLESAMQGHILAEGEIMGTYQRQ
ncbi:MAG TPA: YbhB/YbcL family Raf kinase inhibitor-like protein [Candidatus Kapabacteria bacterium]|nr:YbhB/YbcL family Raf kinase inhibitor-like protein [Candidatus Kapabacteria bacterium]